LEKTKEGRVNMIKRYGFFTDYHKGKPVTISTLMADGEWVSYEDHEAKMKSIARRFKFDGCPYHGRQFKNVFGCFVCNLVNDYGG